MSWLSRLFGKGVKEVTEGVGGLALDIRQAIKGKEVDPDKMLELEAKHLDNRQKQIELNIQEAKSTSTFVAGWRPFVGWVCGLSLAYNFIIRDFIEYMILIFKPDFVPPPTLQIAELFALLTGMLGFGYLRSKDKKEGTSSK